MRFGILVIGLIFVIYGAVRLGVSSLLLMQAHDWIHIADLQEALKEVAEFLQTKSSNSLLAVSPVGYLAYLWVMGALLVVGGIGCVKRLKIGHLAISAFLVLYALLFINFQTINPKVLHLVVCACLLFIYFWLRSREKAVHQQKSDT